MAAPAARSVLMLHGFSQNANIFSKRLGAIRKECGRDVELVFIDGPLILQYPTLPSDSLDEGNIGEVEPTSTDPNLIPRAWWRMNDEGTKANGLESSLEVLRDILKAGKFVGVFGFSQGAAMAVILAALLERPHLYPPFLVDGEAPHPPLTFCVAVSGFRVSDPIATRIFGQSYSTPTLHVMGQTDVVVIDKRSRALIEISANSRVEEHDGGHFVPSKANWRKFFCAYFKDPLSDILSPSFYSSNVPSAVTPETVKL